VRGERDAADEVEYFGSLTGVAVEAVVDGDLEDVKVITIRRHPVRNRESESDADRRRHYF
jgi:hypothetical protein